MPRHYQGRVLNGISTYISEGISRTMSYQFLAEVRDEATILYHRQAPTRLSSDMAFPPWEKAANVASSEQCIAEITNRIKDISREFFANFQEDASVDVHQESFREDVTYAISPSGRLFITAVS